MLKVLFFDYRDLELVEGFARQVEPPRKFEGNPILVSDDPLEGDWMSLYGSVIRRPVDGRWQMWYTVRPPNGPTALAYVESDDGIAWRRPPQDVVAHDGQRTHLVFDQSPHGATIIYDQRERRPGWRYKLMAGASPSDRTSAYHSEDGIHWVPAAENPVIGTNPDCPMSLHRAWDGRYVLYCRPDWADRRVSRRESWDFRHWSEPKIVIDQEPGDHPQTQFYGLGAIPYGAYEIGTLWIYHTEPDDMAFWKMHGHQQPELVYARSGFAWHRAELGTAWIARGDPGTWEWGGIQPASGPVLLEDEIRFYYVGARTEHGATGYPGPQARCGIGFASLTPDRFVGLTAGAGGRILTRGFWTEAPAFHANARVAQDGELRVGVLNLDGQPVEGFSLEDSVPLTGDSTRHRLAWRGNPDSSVLAHRQLRLDVRARRATVYALMAGPESELAAYWRFRIPSFLDMEHEKARM